MRVLVISDTHGRLEKVIEILNYYKNNQPITAIIHCGDHIEDARRLEELYPNLMVYKVPGNCDKEGYEPSATLFVTIEEVPIFITHGHRHHVKYTEEELFIDGEAHDAKIVIFGHTHLARKTLKEAIYLLNPGSLTSPRDTMYGSFAIMALEQGIIQAIDLYLFVDKDHIIKHPNEL